MRRRDFIRLVGGVALAVPPVARAQGSVRRVGALLQYEENNPESKLWLSAFREGFQKLGWSEGRNVRFEYRWAGMDQAAMKQFAKELGAAKPDLILSSSSLTTRILKDETSTIPVLFLNIVDPVGQGLVASLPRPAGNITGFVNLEPSVSGKYVELLREIAPQLKRFAIFYNPTTAPYYEIYLQPFKAAAASFGIEAVALPVHDLAELNLVLAAQAQKPGTGLIAMPDGFNTANAKQIAAIYADRILKGERPGDLPVQFPVKFQMVINLKTAKALGLDVPLFLQQQADEVIE